MEPVSLFASAAGGIRWPLGGERVYLALYRKWRPRRFSDVISQEHITRTLQNQVREGKVAHAYLFTGSRGTGKTTCSKILAKAVNCLNPVDGNPCLECAVCKGIEEGSILDVTEMDAASNNGVNDIRSLRDEANFAPTVCKYRVYIIDEVHMLSQSAFNALLKIMEEPPPHVLFILATTEPHKVPATIISRCQRYDFRRIRPEDSAERLLYIAGEEGITLTEDAAGLIARLSNGGMRDALSLLDQCMAAETEVTPQVVADTAGIAGREQMFALSDAVLSGDTAKALTLVTELYDRAKEIDRICEELTGHFRDMLICRSVRDPSGMVVCLPDELERLRKQADSTPPERILAVLDDLQACSAALGKVPDKKVELEMTIIRLCGGGGKPAVQPQAEAAASADVAALQARIGELERLIASLSSAPGRLAPAAAARETPLPEEQPVRVAPPEPPKSKPEPVRPAPAPEPEPAPEPATEPLPQWEELLREMENREPALFSLMDGSTAVRSGKTVIISSPNPMLRGMLLTNNIGAKLADLVEQKLGSRHKLRIAKKAQPKAAESRPSAFQDILSRAAGEGVEIRMQNNDRNAGDSSGI